MHLQQHETELIGNWLVRDGQIHADETAKRIRWLTSQHLRKIGVHKQWGAWNTLFRDPLDLRYWELTYPRGEMHGGGPPSLTRISSERAKSEYLE